MHETKAMLYLHALTGMHPGSGSALGTVDLPVQRERHTNWPTIPGSALKGVLRDASRQHVAASERISLSEADGTHEGVITAFGPPTSDAHEHSGAVAVTDARLLAFPVRSLKGIFAWVTSPASLQRYQRDLELMGVKVPWQVPELREPEGEQHCLTANGAPLIVAGDHVILEEFEFRRNGACDDIATWIADNAVQEATTAARMKNHLVVISDDAFNHFARYGTEVVARIGLDYERKTVRDGALFYQEFLPAETLFYSLLFVSNSRRSGSSYASADDVFGFLKGAIPDILQVGGDETIGKGLCAVRLNRANGRV